MSISLVSLFDANRQAVLRERLSCAADLQDIAGAIHDLLAEFAHVDSPYVRGLSKSELPVALAILALVRESNGQLVQAAPREPSAKQSRTRRKRSTGRATLPCTIVTVSATLGASAGFFFGAIAGILGAALVGAGATILVGNSAGSPAPEEDNDPEPMVKLDTQKVCEGLLHLFGKIDDIVRVFGEARNVRTPDRPPATLADFPELLQLFQLLWSAVRSDAKDEMVALLQRQFPSLLRGQGLEVVRLSEEELNGVPADNGHLNMCDVDYSREVKSPTLDYPPIRANAVVVVKGRVLLPLPADATK